MPIMGYKYSIIILNSNRLKNTISATIMLGLLYFLSPLKYSFKDEIVDTNVVIIAPRIISPNKTLKRGFMLFDISAKGISKLASVGFKIKQIIPSASRQHRISETATPTCFCCFFESEYPDCIITNEERKVF